MFELDPTRPPAFALSVDVPEGDENTLWSTIAGAAFVALLAVQFVHLVLTLAK